MKITGNFEGIEAMNRALQKFADTVGKDISAILPDEARLFCESAMKAQPPTVGGGKGANTLAAKRAGEGAVQRSHENASPRMMPEDFRSPLLQRLARAGDVAGVQRFLDASGTPIKVGQFDPSYIARLRDRGRGKVFRRRAGNVLITDAAQSERDANAKRKMRNVGYMKGAWGALIAKLNRYTVVKGKVAPWIEHNAGKGQAWLGSSVTVRVTGSKPQVEIYGTTHEVSYDFAQIAIKSRTRSIAKKTREILAGRAGIVNGKFTIFPR